ncbi:hypothetical protein EON80_32590, partial [bacterium]
MAKTQVFEDHETGVMTVVQGDKVKTYPLPSVKGGDGASLGVQGEARQLTRAERRLAKLSQDSQYQPVQEINIPGDDEPWFIKRGSFADLTMASKLAGRNPEGVLSLEEADQIAGFVAAVLRTFVVVGMNNKAPFFESLPDARNFVDSGISAAADAVAVLY